MEYKCEIYWQISFFHRGAVIFCISSFVVGQLFYSVLLANIRRGPDNIWRQPRYWSVCLTGIDQSTLAQHGPSFSSRNLVSPCEVTASPVHPSCCHRQPSPGADPYTPNCLVADQSVIQDRVRTRNLWQTDEQAHVKGENRRKKWLLSLLAITVKDNLRGIIFAMIHSYLYNGWRKLPADKLGNRFISTEDCF